MRWANGIFDIQRSSSSSSKLLVLLGAFQCCEIKLLALAMATRIFIVFGHARLQHLHHFAYLLKSFKHDESNISFQVWRVKYSLALIRSAARELLTLEEKNPRRLFEGNALLRRLVR